MMRMLSCLTALWILVSGLKLDSFAQSEVYRSVETDSMKIAITFDDGPHPTQTKQILDILDAYGVKATFFMVGVNVINYPDAARDVISRGHEVGNHTFSHSIMTHLNEAEVKREMERCEQALAELCDYHPHILRPPQGALNPQVQKCTLEADYSIILWSLDTRDWESKDEEKIVDCVLSSVKSGDIILMHDYIGRKSKTPQALERLLPELLARGFEPVTVRELLYD
ncbi:MAG: polysaccharide deacetylase family protein [Clostridia bacterium]|nr:polysaccharide deacetylase family protein [Clostridia bacterium]